jgi:hypothetical protein
MTTIKAGLAFVLLSLAACTGSGSGGLAYDTSAGDIGKASADPRLASSEAMCKQGWPHYPNVCIPNSGR